MASLIRAGVGAPVREGASMRKVVHEESEANATGGSTGSSSLLDQIVRDGARQMLAAALRAEVAAYIDAHADQLDEHGRRVVVRDSSPTSARAADGHDSAACAWRAAIALGLGTSVLAGVLHGMVDRAYFEPDLALIFWLAIAALILCVDS
jgi:hypothetical protein